VKVNAPVYCEHCEAMTHPTFPHSCFSAAAVRAHKDAERAVLDAALRWHAGLDGDLCDLAYKLDVLESCVKALRVLEGDA